MLVDMAGITLKIPTKQFLHYRQYRILNRNLPGDKGRPARRADNLTAVCETIV
jgi:hypothetical protein